MNINRDYLIINDVKKSNIKLDNGSMFFYITDKNTQNIFVNLVINVSNNDLIQKYANIENAEGYTLTMNIVKPDNTYKIIEGKLHDKENAIFEFNLNEDCCDEIGPYRCELLTKCNINGHEEITTSNKLTYKVKSSVLNDLDDIVEAPEYPLVIQLFDKLSDIEQYEEDRRANELARQLAEEQRQARFNTLDADMTDSIETMDNKVIDVENRITAKEQAVDKLITDTKADIDDYKVAKDQEIDEYKTAKDTEINNAITTQDNKINEFINERNDRLNAIEAKNTEQDGRLDIAENRLANIGNDITNTMQPIIDRHTARLDAIEAIDVAQNNRLEAIEAKNQQQDDRLLDVEKVNSRQDIDIKCLYGASQTIDIAKEGNSIYLQNSNNGFAIIDEIQGNTMVNCNKEPDKEIILNGNINTQGYSNVTLTEGVDGGLVDVALEGNTMVNVCDQKDPVAITKSYAVKTGNHVALQGEYDGKCRPVVTGNTLWIDNATEEVLTAFDDSKNLRLQSSFEDKLVTENLAGVNNFVAWAEIYGYDIICPIFHNDSIKRSFKMYAGKTYTIIRRGVWENVNYSYYDTNDNYIEGGMSSLTYRPTKDGYLQIYFQGTLDDRNEQNLKDLIILEGNYGSSDYDPTKIGKYKVNYVISKEDGTIGQTKTFYLNSPLLEGDTIEQQGNNVVHVHRYKKVVLDGGANENWIKSYVFVECYYMNDYYSSGGLFEEVNILCPTFKSVSNYDFNANRIDGSICASTNTIGITLKSGTLSYDTLDAFKEWLHNNPITIVYKLTTPQYEVISQNDTILCDSYVNGHLDVDSVVPIEKVDFLHFEKDLTYLYANTQYAVQFTSDKAITADITLGGTPLLEQSIVAGLNRISITTPGTLVDNKLIIDGAGAKISEVVVTDTDREFRYFEGMKSVGECEDLEVVSSNLDGTLSNTQTLTHEPLRAVGDIKDKYVLIDGKWYIERNCGEVVLDGSDDEKYVMSNELDSTARFAKDKDLSYRVSTSGICDKLISFSNIGSYNHDVENIRAENDCRLYIRINKSKLTKISPEGFKTWLQSNLLTIVVVLKTPTYEPIDYNPFTVYSNTTHISNNSTIPCNMTIKNTGYNCLLKPSTTYTVSSNLGLNTVTTPTTLTEDCLRFYDTDTSTVTKMNNVTVLEGDYTTGKPIPSHFSGIESAFEQEYDEAVGKYKVKIRVQNEDATKENYIEFYINEPLRGIGDVKDKVYVKNDKVVVERNCGQREYQDGDFGTYLTDKVNTVYQLATPQYEEVEYGDIKLFIESFKNSTLFYNSNVPVTSKVWYSYSVPIVDTVAQTANVTDQQDSMIIDLATQVAVMEMMLM